jgi:hypothetical protein
MQGYIGIDLPTKRYIAAYIKCCLGEQPVISKQHVIGKQLLTMLQRTQNTDKCKYTNKHYNTTLRIHLDIWSFRTYGHNLHETNVKNFNLFVEDLMKEKLYLLLTMYLKLGHKLGESVDLARQDMGLTMEDWPDDGVLRAYHRWRQRNNMMMLGNGRYTHMSRQKKSSAICPIR